MIETSIKTWPNKAKHHLACQGRSMFYFKDTTGTCDSPWLVILNITPEIKYFNNLKIIKPAYITLCFSLSKKTTQEVAFGKMSQIQKAIVLAFKILFLQNSTCVVFGHLVHPH